MKIGDVVMTRYAECARGRMMGIILKHSDLDGNRWVVLFEDGMIAEDYNCDLMVVT